MKEWAKNSPFNIHTKLSDNMESVNDRSKGTDNQLLKGKIRYAYELF